MNLEIKEDKYIYFTNEITMLDEKNISMFLKDVFLNISSIYKIDLFGYFKVDIYIDDKIGSFVEIEKIDEYMSYNKKIDTKVNVEYRDFYLKTNDLSIIYKYRPIYEKNSYYFVSTKDVDNLLDILEYCELEYDICDLKPILR